MRLLTTQVILRRHVEPRLTQSCNELGRCGPHFTLRTDAISEMRSFSFFRLLL